MPQTTTIMIHSGSSKVMAPAGSSSTFLMGQWRRIRVTGVSEDESSPPAVREALVGLVVEVIFTKEEMGIDPPGLPDGSFLTYVPEVIHALREGGRSEEADLLQEGFPGPLDMYTFEPAVCELVA